jgi:hypothetical protein
MYAVLLLFMPTHLQQFPRAQQACIAPAVQRSIHHVVLRQLRFC